MTFMFILLLAGVALAGWIRLAPSDPARWHVAREIAQDRDLAGGVLRVVEPGADALARFDAVVRGTPRTSELAGSVAEGMITYVTRSRVWGFPDYTTVRQTGGRLEIFARSRFGRKDFGVNRARVDAWLAQL